MRLNKNILLLHFTVFIWGFTGILGALISVSAYELVWYRMLIAGISLWIYLVYKKIPMQLDARQSLRLLGIGAIVGLHWFFFYHSIKTSTVSVALICLSSSALSTGLISPLIQKSRFSIVDLITGLLIVAGILMIFHFESRYTEGIIYGLICALLASVFTILNEIEVKKNHSALISFYEMAGGFMLISLYLFFTRNQESYQLLLNSSDIFYLIILGTVCTAFAYVSGVAVMKELSAFTVVLTTNLEPLYGIGMAWIIFGTREQMTPGFYTGASLILGTVFLYPFVKNYFNKRRSTLAHNS